MPRCHEVSTTARVAGESHAQALTRQSHEVISTTSRVATGSLPRHSTNTSLVQKRSDRAYLPATSGWVETWRLSMKLFGWCRRPIQYRERSDRMPALNQRFKSSCDYRVPASGRFARGTVLGGDHARVLPQSTDFSHSLGSDRVVAETLN